MRVEGQNRVSASDHLTVTEVDAIEGPYGDAARPRLDVV
jgi:hypothetical protein